MMARAWIVVTVLGALGCDGAKPGTVVKCSWFEADNCWKTAVQAADECAGARFPVLGSLDATGTSCSYADGTEVRFHSAVDLASKGGRVRGFDLIQAGSTCLTYTEVEQGFSLTLRDLGTFELNGTRVTCPDGTKVRVRETSFDSVAEAFDALGCDHLHMPAIARAWTDGSVGLSLRGAPRADGHLFSCVRSP